MSKAERTSPNCVGDSLRNDIHCLQLVCFVVPPGHWFAGGTRLLFDALYRGGYVTFWRIYSQIGCRFLLIGMLECCMG